VTVALAIIGYLVLGSALAIGIGKAIHRMSGEP
jgi:hypothetical protein